MYIRLHTEDFENLRKMEDDKNKKLAELRHEYVAEDRRADAVLAKARLEANEIVKAARDKYYSEASKVIAEYNERVENYKENIRKVRKVDAPNITKDPLLELLETIFGDLGFNTAGSDETNEVTKEAETHENDKVSLEDKLKFISSNISNLDKITTEAAVALCLKNAKLIKTRKEHTCNCCGLAINVGDIALATYVYEDSDGNSAYTYWENEYDIITGEGDYNDKVVAIDDVTKSTVELKPHKVWIDIDCAYELVNKALKVSTY